MLLDWEPLEGDDGGFGETSVLRHLGTSTSFVRLTTDRQQQLSILILFVFVIQHDAHSYSYFVSSMMLERGTVDIGEHAPLSLLRQGVFPFRPATAHDQACYRSLIEAFDYYLSSFHLFRATP